MWCLCVSTALSVSPLSYLRCVPGCGDWLSGELSSDKVLFVFWQFQYQQTHSQYRASQQLRQRTNFFITESHWYESPMPAYRKMWETWMNPKLDASRRCRNASSSIFNIARSFSFTLTFRLPHREMCLPDQVIRPSQSAFKWFHKL